MFESMNFNIFGINFNLPRIEMNWANIARESYLLLFFDRNLFIGQALWLGVVSISNGIAPKIADFRFLLETLNDGGERRARAWINIILSFANNFAIRQQPNAAKSITFPCVSVNNCRSPSFTVTWIERRSRCLTTCQNDYSTILILAGNSLCTNFVCAVNARARVDKSAKLARCDAAVNGAD